MLLQSSRAYQSVIYGSERRQITNYRLICVSHINLHAMFDVFQIFLFLFNFPAVVCLTFVTCYPTNM